MNVAYRALNAGAVTFFAVAITHLFMYLLVRCRKAGKVEGRMAMLLACWSSAVWMAATWAAAVARTHVVVAGGLTGFADEVQQWVTATGRIAGGLTILAIIAWRRRMEELAHSIIEHLKER